MRNRASRRALQPLKGCLADKKQSRVSSTMSVGWGRAPASNGAFPKTRLCITCFARALPLWLPLSLSPLFLSLAPSLPLSLSLSRFPSLSLSRERETLKEMRRLICVGWPLGSSMSVGKGVLLQMYSIRNKEYGVTSLIKNRLGSRL